MQRWEGSRGGEVGLSDKLWQWPLKDYQLFPGGLAAQVPYDFIEQLHKRTRRLRAEASLCTLPAISDYKREEESAETCEGKEKEKQNKK